MNIKQEILGKVHRPVDKVGDRLVIFGGHGGSKVAAINDREEPSKTSTSEAEKVVVKKKHDKATLKGWND